MITCKAAQKRAWTGHFLGEKSGKDILVRGTRGCRDRWRRWESASVSPQGQICVSGDRDATDLAWAVRTRIDTLGGLTLSSAPLMEVSRSSLGLRATQVAKLFKGFFLVTHKMPELRGSPAFPCFTSKSFQVIVASIMDWWIPCSSPFRATCAWASEHQCSSPSYVALN